MYSTRVRKIVAFLMILFIMGNVIGCSKKESIKSLPEYIEETTEWYSCESNTIDNGDAGNVDNSFPVFANANCKVFYKYYDESTYESCGVLTYINDLDETTIINVYDSITNCESIELKSCFYNDDNCYAVVNSVSYGENHSSIYRINDDIGLLEFVYEFDRNIKETSYFVDKVISTPEGYYAHIYYLDDNSNYKDAFCILDSQYNTIETFDYNNAVLMWTLNDSNQIVIVQNNQNNYGDSQFSVVSLDTDSNETTVIDIDSEIISRYRLGYISDNGYIYMVNQDLSLTKLCLFTGEEELVLDFNNSDMSIFDLDCSNLLYSDDETILLIKSTYYPSESLDWKIYSLTKNSVNPHVGKQILYVAPYFKVNSLAANAIRQMNEVNDTTYIYVTMKYSSLLFDDYERDDNSVISQYNKSTALLNILKQDIRTGEGPDILLDFGRFSTLNTSEYLCDLLSIVNDTSEFNREEYFDNIFDSYIKNGQLYQLPVSACIGGIYTDESAVVELQNGFTYDEYINYIDFNCNGFDPLEDALGRDRCFSVLIRSSYDELYDDNNNLTLNNDSFRDICNYTSSINETPSPDSNNSGIDFVEFNRIHFDLSRMMISEDKELLGLPSANGDNGPIIFPYETVGITGCTSQFNEAFEFVKTMLCFEVQITNVTYNPINIEAFEYYANDALNYSNNYIEEMYGIESYNEESIINEYIGYISSADTCYIGDDYSMLIMCEELQPFYSGQKTIDEVIDIIEDRVNNMMDENA